MGKHRFFQFFTQPVVTGALAMVFGMGAYFSLPFEPTVTALVLMSMTGVGLMLASVWQESLRQVVFVFVGVLLLAFGYAGAHTRLLNTPFWPHKLASERIWVVGQIESVEQGRGHYGRMVLTDAQVYGTDEAPARLGHIMVSAHQSRLNQYQPGDWVAAQVKLSPPRAPLLETDIDYRLRSYAEGGSAVGLVMGDLYRTSGHKPPVWRYKVRQLREAILTDHMQTAPTPAIGAVSAGLMVGMAGTIPSDVWDDYRKSGLAHLIAISGSHMAMLALFIYLGIRSLICLWPRMALQYDIRIPAAVIALMGAFVYMLMAGASIPVVRAFIMVAALMLAILLGRLSVSLRILALAAIGLLLWRPSIVVGASFQLSFAASLALVAWAAWRRFDVFRGIEYRGGMLRSIVEVSIVAGLASLPFIAVHFGQVSISGFIANIIGVPFMAFAVLPVGFFHLLTGAEWAQTLYHHSVAALNAIAHHTGQLPGSEVIVSGYGTIIAFVGAWGTLSLFITGRRLWALLIGAVALAGIYAVGNKQADYIVFPRAEAVLVKSEEGYTPLWPVADSNLRRDVRRAAERLQGKGTVTQTCDAHACLSRKVLVMHPSAVASAEDCAQAEHIISAYDSTCGTIRPDEGEVFYVWNNGRIKSFKAGNTRLWQR